MMARATTAATLRSTAARSSRTPAPTRPKRWSCPPLQVLVISRSQRRICRAVGQNRERRDGFWLCTSHRDRDRFGQTDVCRDVNYRPHRLFHSNMPLFRLTRQHIPGSISRVSPFPFVSLSSQVAADRSESIAALAALHKKPAPFNAKKGAWPKPRSALISFWRPVSSPDEDLAGHANDD